VRAPRLEDEQLDKTLTGAPSHVAAAERSLPRQSRAAFREGAGEGVAGGFAAVMTGLGLIALLSALGWLALMRRARAP
jgi:hypothetical protein